MPAPLSLYVHVPFCVVRCRYCDFFSLAGRDAERARAVEALCREVRDQAHALAGRRLATIFVGGGTPTHLEEADLERLLAALAALPAEADLEFTVEANPESLSRAKLRLLAGAGVNRLSIGVQSFEPRALARLGRPHDAKTARAAVLAARECGFDNLNLDLMHGFPGQSFAALRSDLEQALGLGPEHLACYEFHPEPETPLGREVLAGQARLPSPESGRRRLEWKHRRLADAGYRRYEISNFARPGRECRHNRNYWRYGEWLAAGPSATSQVAGVRRTRPRSLERWMAGALAGECAGTIERPDPAEAARERLMLGLRTAEGADLAALRRETGLDPETLLPPAIARYEREGLVARAPGRLALTEAGMYVASPIMAEILAWRLPEEGRARFP